MGTEFALDGLALVLDKKKKTYDQAAHNSCLWSMMRGGLLISISPSTPQCQGPPFYKEAHNRGQCKHVPLSGVVSHHVVGILFVKAILPPTPSSYCLFFP